MGLQENAIDLTATRSLRQDESSSLHPVTHGSFFDWTIPHPDPEEDCMRRPFEHPRVMVLDGGVIYQLAVLSFLQELMLVIIEVEVAEDDKVESSSDSPLIRWSRVDAGFRFCHYFDYICGMGFGGISAILLGRRRATIGEALNTMQQFSAGKIQKLLRDRPSPSSATWGPLFFFRYFKQLFGFDADPKGDSDTKRDLSGKGVMDGFDESEKLESTFGMCRTLVITSHDDATHRDAPYIFRSYEILDYGNRGFKNPDKPSHSVPLLDICYATLSPRKRPWNINTPSIEATFHDASSEGVSARDEVEKEITALHSGSIEQSNKDGKLAGTRSWFSASAAEGATKESLGNICLDKSHLKLPGLAQESKSDRSDTFRRIETLMKEYCATDDVKKTLHDWAKKMVAWRKHRAGFERWETFAFGVHYKCCICEDEGRNSGFMDVDAWGSHIANKHETPPFTVEERCRVVP